jgi:hypothetical protein
MGTLSAWISIALVGLMQVKGISSVDIKSCNASKFYDPLLFSNIS